jgi:hypothetical protein
VETRYGFQANARLTQSLDHQAVETRYGFQANARLTQSLNHLDMETKGRGRYFPVICSSAICHVHGIGA